MNGVFRKKVNEQYEYDNSRNGPLGGHAIGLTLVLRVSGPLAALVAMRLSIAVGVRSHDRILPRVIVGPPKRESYDRTWSAHRFEGDECCLEDRILQNLITCPTCSVA